MVRGKGMSFGLIADGNRRWARTQNLPVFEGHKKGFEVVREVFFQHLYEDPCWDTFVVYAFSTENWKRSELEVSHLMQLYLDIARKWKGEILEKKCRFIHAGRKDRLPKVLLSELSALEEETRSFQDFTLVMCLDYGSQDEIRRAVAKGGENFEDFLEVPPLDYILRTGGEKRLSNFCLYQAAYAELCFHETFLPAFTKADLVAALEDFYHRDRRKGA